MSKLSRVNSIRGFLSEQGSHPLCIDEIIDISPSFVLIVSDYVKGRFTQEGYRVPPDVIRVCGEVGPSSVIDMDHRRLLTDNGAQMVRRGQNIHLRHRGQMELYRFKPGSKLEEGLERLDDKRNDVWDEYRFKLPLLFADAPEAFSSAPRLNTAYRQWS